jgi:rod shape-determining protein MreC
MENVISRFRNTLNLIVLVGVLIVQVIMLAVQVKRSTDAGSTPLLRIWAIAIVTPVTRSLIHTDTWFSNTWHNYLWLRGVRKENEDLKDQIAQMKMEQVRLVEDANQARRLQLLLGFKEKYISQTVPAQVISTTGSEFSRAIYIDKGTNDGIKQDMPVVRPEGIVGKVLRAFPSTSLVLLINDPTSGAGVILEKSRLQGILKGSSSGVTAMHNVMTDEKVQVGEAILTSGGDGVYPKGLRVGTVGSVTPGQDLFLNIRVRPAAPLGQLEEVLVITKMEERSPDAVASDNPVRAIDILAQRLPTVAPPPPAENKTSGSDIEGSKKPDPKPQASGISSQKPVTGEVQPVKQGQTGSATKPQPSVVKDKDQ